MSEILSIKLFAARAARIFPGIKIRYEPKGGLLGKFMVPRRLFLVERSSMLFLVFTNSGFEHLHNVLDCKPQDISSLLYDDYQAGEYTPLNFRELFDFLTEKNSENHYLMRLLTKYDRQDKEGLEDQSSFVSAYGESCTNLINKCCLHSIGKRFEYPIDVLRGDEMDIFGNDFVDMIFDVCLVAPYGDENSKNRILKDHMDTFGRDLVDFVYERSQEFFREISYRFRPELFLQSLISDDAPSPGKFEY